MQYFHFYEYARPFRVLDVLTRIIGINYNIAGLIGSIITSYNYEFLTRFMVKFHFPVPALLCVCIYTFSRFRIFHCSDYVARSTRITYFAHLLRRNLLLYSELGRVYKLYHF